MHRAGCLAQQSKPVYQRERREGGKEGEKRESKERGKEREGKVREERREREGERGKERERKVREGRREGEQWYTYFKAVGLLTISSSKSKSLHGPNTGGFSGSGRVCPDGL